MSVQSFQSHLRDKAPGFRCYAAGDKTKTVAFLAKVTHDLGAPAKNEALNAVKQTLKEVAEPFRELWQLHDGMSLYCDPNSDAVGVEFFSIANWPSETEEMHSEMGAMGFDVEAMPEWFPTCVVFGQIPHSGNYFAVSSEGQSLGQIYYLDHDDYREDPIATSLVAFLDAITANPATFLYERGCYTRYSDGKTNKQWIPQQYIPDHGKLT